MLLFVCLGTGSTGNRECTLGLGGLVLLIWLLGPGFIQANRHQSFAQTGSQSDRQAEAPLASDEKVVPSCFSFSIRNFIIFSWMEDLLLFQLVLIFKEYQKDKSSIYFVFNFLLTYLAVDMSTFSLSPLHPHTPALL